ncbi:MAG: PilZ domain-containing protein [Candidatus Sulfotelmatobacter sp.]
MGLKSLLLCSDDKIVRVLRRVLGDLDIELQVCADADSALYRLTRRRFEGIIVDCAAEGASQVLRSARSAPCNKQAVAVAIVEPAVGLREVFALGAHFVLYKPVSGERVKSSFRAARALMKSERRRNARVVVEIPVTMQDPTLGDSMKVTTIDVSEGGMAVRLPKRRRPSGRWQISFALPGTQGFIDLPAEFAWEGAREQAGLRFLETSPQAARQLREWLTQNSSEVEPEDPPIRCQLTDLSLGGCYLEMSSPFPLCTRVTLSMRAAGVEVRAQGVVRIMHPDKGMGVEFKLSTVEHRAAVERFLSVLTENRDLRPELLVQPEGLETDSSRALPAPDCSEDPLLQLFYGEPLSPEVFHATLCQQRLPIAAAQSAAEAAS